MKSGDHVSHGNLAYIIKVASMTHNTRRQLGNQVECDEVALNIIDKKARKVRILCNVAEDENAEEWSRGAEFSMRLDMREVVVE